MHPTIALPRNRIQTTIGLLLLSLVLPPLAVYLDGGSHSTVLLSILMCYLGFLPAVVHAIFYVLRSRKRRMMSRPMRYRLWAFHSPAVAKQIAESVPIDVVSGGKQTPDVFSNQPLPVPLKTRACRLSSIPEQPSSVSIRDTTYRPQSSRRSSSSSYYMTRTSLDANPFKDPPVITKNWCLASLLRPRVLLLILCAVY